MTSGSHASPGVRAAARGRKVFVVSGPSGAGKGTLIRAVSKFFTGIDVAVSVTTRTARPGEVEAREYYFRSNEEFDQLIADGELLEHVRFASNRYGTLWREIERIHELGHHVILELELNGALAVQTSDMDTVLIFIETPDFAELERRLRSRASDTDAEIQERLAVARAQFDARTHFDHVIVNDDQDRAVAELHDVIARELAPAATR